MIPFFILFFFFFSKIRIFYLIFLQKSKKLSFSREIFSCQNLLFKNRDNFFSVRYPVDKPSCRRFLKYLKNHAVFEFFSVFLMKRVTPLFFTGDAGNACQAIALPFLFQNPSDLKNKCWFLMWFLKKKIRWIRLTH